MRQLQNMIAGQHKKNKQMITTRDSKQENYFRSLYNSSAQRLNVRHSSSLPEIELFFKLMFQFDIVPNLVISGEDNNMSHYI